MNTPETVQAIAVARGHPQSAVASAAYVITPTTITETVLYTFSGNRIDGRPDGASPQASLIEGSDGNFYGTTSGGGRYEPGVLPGFPCDSGCGTVFKVTPAGVEAVLHQFKYGDDRSTDGATPHTLIQASDGNFYGTTFNGGAYAAGTFFKLTPAGVETVLYSFGAFPYDGLNPVSIIQGSDGNFYGTTFAGGNGGCNCISGGGTVFKVTPDGIETLIYSSPGAWEVTYSGLIQGSNGNFLGTTVSTPAYQLGTVFEITPAGVENWLYAFGAYPGDAGYLYNAGGITESLIQAGDGNFYGITDGGGAENAGAVFKLTPAGVESVLHSFSGSRMDGSFPIGLIQASDGNFYGTTLNGGQNDVGTAFKVTPAGVETVLHTFNGGTDGFNPWAGLIEGSDGNFYGTTANGGAYGQGTVFKLTGVIAPQSSSKPKTSSAVE